MNEFYPTLKMLHVSTAIISICFFILRAYWSIRGSQILNKTWVKISPHLIDTVLLCSAIALTIVIKQYPLQSDWLTAKVIALVLYIGFGTMAIKKAATKKGKIAFSVLAVLTFMFILHTAATKQLFF